MSVKSPVHDTRTASVVMTNRFDRFFGLTGLAVAVATVGVGLVAQTTGYGWLVWVAAGFVGVGLVGLFRGSVRYLLAFDIRPVLSWFIASWLVVGVGAVIAALVAGDSVSLLSIAGLRSLIGSEAIAVSSVVTGLGVGLASVGLLRGSVRVGQRSHLLASGLLSVVGVGVLVGGMVAWVAPVSIGELEHEADVLETDSGVRQVIEIPGETREGGYEPFEMRAYGYDGTGDPASEGWDQWVVVGIDESTGEQTEVIYGPVSEEAASLYIGDLDMGARTVLFEGTEAEINEWLQEEGAGYKDHLVPAFLVWMGVLLIGSALTLSPRRRQALTG